MHSLTDYTHLPPLHFSDTAQKSLEEGEMLEAEMLEQGAEKVSDSLLLLGSFKDNTTVHAGHTTSPSLSSLRI